MERRKSKLNTFLVRLNAVTLSAALVTGCPVPVMAFQMSPLSLPTTEAPPEERTSPEIVKPAQVLPGQLKFEPISDVAINAGNLVTFDLSATTNSGGEVRYEIGNIPEGAMLVENEFRWQPDSSAVGQYELVFKATDGSETIEQTVTLFFLPASKTPEGYRASPQRSALVLPDEKGWIVIIPSGASGREDGAGRKTREPSEKGEPLEEGEFRVGEDGLAVGPNVGPGAIILFDPFLQFPRTPKPQAAPNPPPPGTGPVTPPPTPNDGDGPDEPDFTARLLGDQPGLNTSPPGVSPFHNTFTDVTALTGLGNTFGRGAAFSDLDGNGILDLYVASPYRSLENSIFIRFEPDPLERNILFSGAASGAGGEIAYTDVTQARSAEMTAFGDPNMELERPQGTIFGDIDNDGDRDLFLPNLNRANVLLRNNGAGQPFQNISSSSGVNDTGQARGAVFSDFNLDGRLDIFISNGGSANKLYINQNGSVFSDQAPALGLTTAGDSLGAVAFDADADGDSDLYVLNIGASNQLFRNNVVPSGTFSFTDVAGGAGVAHEGFPLGVEAGDLNNDGLSEIFVADLTRGASKLYRNTSSSGNISFSDISSSLESLIPGGAFPPATGAAFFDIHNDGLTDVYVITENAPNIMFRNNGNFGFAEVTDAEVVFHPDFTDSVATLDYNSDGLTDIFVASTPSLLYKNITVNNLRWLKVDVRPLTNITNKDGIGALVKVRRTDGVVLTQEVSGGTGRSQDSRILHFGMGSTVEAAEVTVVWPTQPPRSTVLSAAAADLSVNQTIVVSDSGSPFFTLLPSDPVPAGQGLEDSFEIRVLDPDRDDLDLQVSFNSPALFETHSLIQTGTDGGSGAEIWKFTYKPQPAPNEEANAVITFTVRDNTGSPSANAAVNMHIFTKEMFNIAPAFAASLPDDPTVVNEGVAMDPLLIVGVDLDRYLTGVLNASVSVNPPVPVGPGPQLVDINTPPIQISDSGKTRAMRLSWTPASGAGSAIPYTVTVTLSDGIESTTDSLNIIVPPSAPNIAPVWLSGEPSGTFSAAVGQALTPAINLLNALDPATLEQNETLAFGVSEVRDHNGGLVTLGGTVNISNGLFSFTPHGNDFVNAAGQPLVFKFSVTDNVPGRLADISDGTPISITSSIQPPFWIDSAFPAENHADATSGVPFTLDLLLDMDAAGGLDRVDYDGLSGDLVFGISGLNGRNAEITDGVFTYRPNVSEIGAQSFSLTVHDVITPASVDTHVVEVNVLASLTWNDTALETAVANQVPLAAGETRLQLDLASHVLPPGLPDLNFRIAADSHTAFNDGQISNGIFGFIADPQYIGQTLSLAFDVRQGTSGDWIPSHAQQIQVIGGFLFKDMTTDATAGEGLGYFGDGPVPQAKRAVISDFKPDHDGTLPNNPLRSERNALEDLLVVSSDGASVVPHTLNAQTAGDLSDLNYQALSSIPVQNAKSIVPADFNNDGLKDIYVVANGANRVYRNVDGISFQLAENTGAEDESAGSGAVVADLDLDGKVDLYVLNDGANKLYRNISNAGAILFQDITGAVAAAGADANTVSAAFLDINDDGLLDIFLIHSDADNELLVNTSRTLSSPFTLAPESAGLNHTGIAGDRALTVNQSAAPEDLRIFVLNDDPAKAQLLKPDLEAAPIVMDGTGISIQPFTDVWAGSGIGLGSFTPGTLRDAAFGDFDNDGDDDLLVAPATGEILLFNATGPDAYTQVSAAGLRLNPLNNTLESVSVLDINQDGLLDVLAAGSVTQVFLNKNDEARAQNHYLQISLEGDPELTGTSKDALGALVTVFPLGLGHNPVSRKLLDGSSGGSHSRVIHFGLGDLSDIGLILIAWPGGAVQEITEPFDLAANQRYKIVENDTGTENISLDVSLKNVSDNSAASLLHFTPTLADPFVDGEQYIEVEFKLDGPSTSLSMFTDNRHNNPAYSGTFTTLDTTTEPPLMGSGMIGVNDRNISIPMLWQVYHDVRAGGVFFQNDIGATEGAVLDTGYPGFSLDPSEFSEFAHADLAFVTNDGQGQLGAFPPDSVNGRSFDASQTKTARIYFAGDFSGAPSQDYSTRIVIVLSTTP